MIPTETKHTPDSRTYRLVGSENTGFTLHAVIPEVGDSMRLASFSALDHGSADVARRTVATLNACAGINPEAVPDLLAALQTTTRLLALLNDPGANDPIESAVFKARAAISKATD